jgi:tetratricopeptide (TPR) repeat protein
MRSIASRLALAALLGATVATPSLAQDFPPPGYAPLLFNRDPVIHVFRMAGVPWICTADSFCKQIRIDGVPESDLPTATIQPLGFADRRFHLSFQHINHNKGRPVVLGCRDDQCTRIDARTGEAAFLGSFNARQGDQVSGRVAILRKLDDLNGRSQILWCAETCAELPATRDSEYRFAFLGLARHEGRERAWLRDRGGAVLACAQAEVDVTDRLDCERTMLTLGDFPGATPAASPPPAPPPPPPPPVATNTETNQRVLAAAINQALLADDVLRAEPMIADAVRRFPGAMATWGPFQQRLANIKANQARTAKMEEARRLITEARRLASFGDFAGAERLLQEADRASPNFAETAKARTDIAALRVARDGQYRERYQLNAAIDRALASYALWEAERLITDALRRYPNDPEFRADANRLAQLRQQIDWLNRLAQARTSVTSGRQALDRREFGEVERQLAIADNLTPGLPEANQLRADLGRARAQAQVEGEQLRLLIAAFEAAILGRRFDEADRLLDDGTRRFPNRPDWTDQRRRLAAARGGDDRQVRDQRERRERASALINQARQAGNQGDYARALAMLNEAQELAPGLPDIAAARADVERQRADRQRQEAELQATVASIEAALARGQFDNAERLLADGRRRYPQHGGWDTLARRIADARRDAAAKPPAPPPPGPPNRLETKPGAPPPPPGQLETRPDPQVVVRVRTLVAQARAAIARNELDTAERAVVEAERLDARSGDVVQVRAELDAAERRAGRPRGKN